MAAAVLMGAGVVAPPDSVKAVMAEANKGKESLYNRVVEGKGKPEDAKKLAELYAAMASMKPPMGDAAAFETKAKALAEAAKEVADGKEGAVAKLKSAGNCKACHDAHKPKK
jgi:hypothetical protein